MKIFLSALFCVGSPETGCGPKSVNLHTIFTRNLFRRNLRHKTGQKEFIGLSRLGESISPDLMSGIRRTCAWTWVETTWLVGTRAVQTQGIPKSELQALCVCSHNTLFLLSGHTFLCDDLKEELCISFFNWRIIALQDCVGFCHITT